MQTILSILATIICSPILIRYLVDKISKTIWLYQFSKNPSWTKLYIKKDGELQAEKEESKKQEVKDQPLHSP